MSQTFPPPTLRFVGSDVNTVCASPPPLWLLHKWGLYSDLRGYKKSLEDQLDLSSACRQDISISQGISPLMPNTHRTRNRRF